MTFRYLGTAAAEGWPAMFCACEACRKAAAAGGKNIRTRSQAVIDGRLLIDFPADTYLHYLQGGMDLPRIRSCLITHDHSDHLYAPDLEMRRNNFAYPPVEGPLTFYGPAPAGRAIRAAMEEFDLEADGRVRFVQVTPYVPFEVENYTVTALKADHDPACEPVFYRIGDGTRTILYAHDTGYFPDDTWAYLESVRPRFDFVSLDCTVGIDSCRHGHMDVRTADEVRRRLLEEGMADARTVFCTNHFSHNGRADYDEMVPVAARYGMQVSYDGMTLTI